VTCCPICKVELIGGIICPTCGRSWTAQRLTTRDLICEQLTQPLEVEPRSMEYGEEDYAQDLASYKAWRATRDARIAAQKDKTTWL